MTGTRSRRGPAFSCETVREDVAGVPLVAADGEFAAVTTDRESLAFAIWRDGADDWEDVVLTGPPAECEDVVFSVPEVRMIDSDSLDGGGTRRR